MYSLIIQLDIIDRNGSLLVTPVTTLKEKPTRNTSTVRRASNQTNNESTLHSS